MAFTGAKPSFSSPGQIIGDIISALENDDEATVRFLMPPTAQNETPTLLDKLRTVEGSNPFTNTPLNNAVNDFNLEEKHQKIIDPSALIVKDVTGDMVQSIQYILVEEGDTLVYVGTPTIYSEQPPTDCGGIKFDPQVFRVHSEKLFALSDSVFPELLQNAHYQNTVKTRLRNLRKETIHAMMKDATYVLDLTPPDEGDHAAQQLSALSLSPGITKWWSSSIVYGVGQGLVLGHDDICSCKKTQPSPTKSDADTATQRTESTGDPMQITSESADDNTKTTSEAESKGDSEPPKKEPELTLCTNPISLLQMRQNIHEHVSKTTPHLIFRDYCPFRHANGIIRLMMMIEGEEALFNSAPRVWTMVGISEIFRCPSVVRDQVTSWILSNPEFIEVLPEETLRIGFALRIPQITLSAFSILVYELAVELAGGDMTRETHKHSTVFGRQKGLLGDELTNLVQHAAGALNERVTSSVRWFEDGQKVYGGTSAELQKLMTIEDFLQHNLDSEEAIEAFEFVRDTLIPAIDMEIDSAISVISPKDTYREIYNSMDMDLATYLETNRVTLLKDVMDDLNSTQKLLCPFRYHSTSKRLEALFTGRIRQERPMRFQELMSWVKNVARSLQEIADQDPEITFTPGFDALFCDSPWGDGSRCVRSPLIDFEAVDHHLMLRAQTWAWLESRGLSRADSPPTLTRHMNLTLTSHELRFLPPWAGGENDESGGVFSSPLPPAVLGPNGPGPAYHTGITELSVAPSLPDSLTDEVAMLGIRGSTVVGSIDAQDSFSTVYRPGHVIAANSSISTDTFEDSMTEFETARFEEPSEHQAEGRAIDMILDSMSMDWDWSDTSSVTETGQMSED